MTIHEPDCNGRMRPKDDVCMDWCYGCARCEPLRLGDYRVCGECFHVFRTEEELIERASRRWMVGADHSPTSVADSIAVCPICAHDF